MDSSIDLSLRWIALIVGIVLVAPYIAAVFMNSINEAMFANVMNKLLVSGDLSRAMKLCTVAQAPVALATHASLSIVADGSVLRRDDAEDYRTAGATLDPATVKQRLTNKFIAAFDEQRRRLIARRIAAVVGVLPLVAIAIDAVFRRVPDAPLVGAGLALVTLFWTVKRDATERSAALRMLSSIEDAMYARALEPNTKAAPRTKSPIALWVEEPGAEPFEFAIVEPIIKIGRTESSQLWLRSDEVARMHAVIENTDEELVLIDLGAPNGTLVNDVAINKHTLSNGDRIRIGPYTLTVRIQR